MLDRPNRKASTFTGLHERTENAGTLPCLEQDLSSMIEVFENPNAVPISDRVAIASGRVLSRLCVTIDGVWIGNWIY
jgi:hypothetical protein